MHEQMKYQFERNKHIKDNFLQKQKVKSKFLQQINVDKPRIEEGQPKV